MKTIKVGKCPVCDSTQTEVVIENKRLSARARCIRCGETGARIKVSSKDDIDLACEVAARTFSTRILEESEEDAIPKLDSVAKVIASFLSEICAQTKCSECVLRSGYENSLNIDCYRKDKSDVKKSLLEMFPGWE